ncbi:iron chaperone [Alkalicoccobacillus plakortidis]|uniref:Iron chaperone n=1 Tax=Alkalicoccobacillus plakortidis TaxID=444060 RepID=A0ABT0XP04_9BACI|nr:iron chaperone [Alkalicoccobacillus plakortidis]MCM2677621.1 iron chaperone [Alkalicoccobacillus plakortidis]
MEVFSDFLAGIDNPEHRARTEEVLAWVSETYPNLVPKIAWNQPMFTDHDTFIIGFSVAKQHLAVAPEKVVIDRFSTDIVAAGYEHTAQLIRMKWKKPTDFLLLAKLIDFNIQDKAEYTAFWRK